MEDMGNYGYTLFRTIPKNAHHLEIMLDSIYRIVIGGSTKF
ncbi:hypothetical protein HMPREF9431_01544 [Segatella oulorum F0390]|mgnify:FL=1|uniref:Uncharacterized protein n=1 Tax=Segatella oulorum F0390 TaxID=702438 RepID=G1WCJ3_9BACT|nr:hypothetical protein HMPREF9431_01544 [Segatella oulorum F0390]